MFLPLTLSSFHYDASNIVLLLSSIPLLHVMALILQCIALCFHSSQSTYELRTRIGVLYQLLSPAMILTSVNYLYAKLLLCGITIMSFSLHTIIFNIHISCMFVMMYVLLYLYIYKSITLLTNKSTE